MKGVYAIRCADGRAYVGGSVNVEVRLRNHRAVLNSGKHQNRPLQEAWLDLGAEAFAFVVLELVADGDDLISAEQRWIDATIAEGRAFNRAPTAGSNLGVVHTPENRAKNAAAQRGKKLSPEHREKLAAAGRNRSHSSETRAKMAAAHRGELAPMAKLSEAIVRDIRRRVRAGEPRRAIARLYGVHPESVSKICRGETWAHVTDDAAADFRVEELAPEASRQAVIEELALILNFGVAA